VVIYPAEHDDMDGFRAAVRRAMALLEEDADTLLRHGLS
jgi:hypothetical protein